MYVFQPCFPTTQIRGPFPRVPTNFSRDVRAIPMTSFGDKSGCIRHTVVLYYYTSIASGESHTSFAYLFAN